MTPRPPRTHEALRHPDTAVNHRVVPCAEQILIALIYYGIERLFC